MFLKQGWLKPAILEGGSSYKEMNPVPEAARNRNKRPWPLNPVKLSRKWPDLAEISILTSLET